MKYIREASGAKLKVHEAVSASGGTRVDLFGSTDQICNAFGLLLGVAFGGAAGVQVQLLIPADKAGIIIGKGGENLKRCRQLFNIRATVEREPVVDPSTFTSERLLQIVTGDDVGYSVQALSFLLSNRQGQPTATALSHVKNPSEDPDHVQVHVVIPEPKLAGAVLGPQGERMKSIAANTGCNVSVTPREAPGERRVVILGGFQQNTTAQALVIEQMAEVARQEGNDLPECTVILLMRSEAAGAVIGKQGQGLVSLRESTSCKVEVGRAEVSGHRPVRIHGALQSVLQCEKMVHDAATQAIAARMQGLGAGGAGNLAGANGHAPPGGVRREPHNTIMPAAWAEPMAKRLRADAGHSAPEFGGCGGRPLGDGAEATKLLVPGDSAGAIIGKSGSGLKSIREACGVKVDMKQQVPQWPGTRLVVLQGPMEARQAAVSMVLEIVSASHESCELRMLVPSSKAGRIVGRGGQNLKMMREQGGLNVKVERDDVMGERLVTAMGSLSQVGAAGAQVMWYLEQSEGQGTPQHGFGADAPAADMSMACGYSGDGAGAAGPPWWE